MSMPRLDARASSVSTRSSAMLGVETSILVFGASEVTGLVDDTTLAVVATVISAELLDLPGRGDPGGGDNDAAGDDTVPGSVEEDVGRVDGCEIVTGMVMTSQPSKNNHVLPQHSLATRESGGDRESVQIIAQSAGRPGGGVTWLWISMTRPLD